MAHITCVYILDFPFDWVNWVWVRVSGAVNDNVIRHPSAALARGTLISIIAISGYYNLCEVSGSESKRMRKHN